MSESDGRAVGRRSVLGGAAAGVAGAVLAPAAAWAGGAPGRAGGAPDRTVDAVASRLDGHLIELRRELHRHPETAGTEQRSAALVARELRSAGLRVRTGVGGHGVVGVLDGGRPGRTVAYRADLDAVAADSQFGDAAAAAHVCGHDLHTTIGVGIALVLARLRERLAGRVMFVFQPAEEDLTGAAAMLADGVFDRVRPAEIHALHCGPFPVGQFVVALGTGMPGLDRGVVTLTGPDAAARARQLADGINALGTIRPPADPAGWERLVADLLTADGPLARFVFMRAGVSEAAGRADVSVSYRCWPEPRWVEVRRAVHRLAAAAGASSVTFPDEPFPALVTPPREGRALQRHLTRALGADRVLVQRGAVPFNGEDFALFLGRIPGTYSFLGVRAPGAELATSYPHFTTFDPDERAIGYGVRAMAGWLTARTAA